MEGVIAIAEGMNPRLIQSKLEAFQHNREGLDSPELGNSPIRRVVKTRTALQQ
jgi:flagellar motor component MotA